MSSARLFRRLIHSSVQSNYGMDNEQQESALTCTSAMNVITAPIIFARLAKDHQCLAPNAIIVIRVDFFSNLMTPDGSSYAANDSTDRSSDTRHYGANRSSGRSAT